MTWLLSIECLNTANVAETLYFSDDSYVSDLFIVYPNRLTQPSNLTISPNDGGILSIFKSSSIGDIELNNTDRALDFLFPNNTDSSKTYKLDGRIAILKLNGTEYLRATIDSVFSRDGKIVLSLKALSDSLVNPIDLDEYSAANDDLNGDGNLTGTAIPVVYGYSKQITPFRTSLDKEIYQASNNNDAVIVAVYSDGNRYVNYETSGSNTVGSSSIVVKSGVGGIPNGSWLAVESSGGEINFYQTTAALADDADLLPATIPITPNLINTIAANTPVEIVNSYADTAAMIADSDACVIDTPQTTDSTLTWRSYNGYFRLIYNSQSTVITCDVATRLTSTSNSTDKAFDVFEKIIKDEGITKAGNFIIGNSYRIHFVGTTDFMVIGASANTIGIDFTATGTGSLITTGKAKGISLFTVNQTLKTAINAYGDLGVYYNTEKPKKDLLDDVIRSIGACYWVIGKAV